MSETLRVLFDACCPAPLKAHFKRHIVSTAQDEEWEGLENGDLYATGIEAGFDAFITADTDFAKPHLFPKHPIPVFLLRATPSAVTKTLAPLVPLVEDIISEGAGPRLYILDNHDGDILASSSLEDSKIKRSEARRKRPGDARPA